jgi:hypothetical protein
MENEKIVGFHHVFSCSPFKTIDYADLKDGEIYAMVNLTGHKKPVDIQNIYDQMGIHHYTPEIKDICQSIERLVNFGTHYIRYNKNILFYGNESGYVNFAMVCIYLSLYYKARNPEIRKWVASLKPPKYMPIYSVINDALYKMGVSGQMNTEMAAAIMKYENQLKEQYTEKDKDDEKR